MGGDDAWTPLEANPEVMDELLREFGVPSEWSLHDVLGLEPEQLEWIPKPALAVLLLFPCSERVERAAAGDERAPPPKLVFFEQTVSNACGTVAVAHAVANNAARLRLADCEFSRLVGSAGALSPRERGHRLLSSAGVAREHERLAAEGQSQPPTASDPSNHHFVAFVHHEGRLYELDGRKPQPVDHGATSPDALLEDAAKICKKFMARDPERVEFTVIALAAAN